MTYLNLSNIDTKEKANEELSINKLNLGICGLEAFGALIVKIDVDPYDRWEIYGLIPHDNNQNYYVKSFIVVENKKSNFYMRELLPEALSVIKAIEFLNPEK